MSFSGFLADGQAVVRDRLRPWSEKSVVPLKHHELMAAVDPEAGPTIVCLLQG